jgi:hypothetical protein
MILGSENAAPGGFGEVERFEALGAAGPDLQLAPGGPFTPFDEDDRAGAARSSSKYVSAPWQAPGRRLSPAVAGLSSAPGLLAAREAMPADLAAVRFLEAIRDRRASIA